MSDTTAPSPAPSPAASDSTRDPAPGTPAASSTGSARGTILAVLFLAAVAFGVFAKSLEHQLVYDDTFLINNNTSMQAVVGNFPAAFSLFTEEYWEGVNPDRPAQLRTRGQALYRPLTVFCWACVYWATDGEYVAGAEYPALPYHLLSVLANVVAVLLLFFMLRRLTGSGRLAFVAALLFAVHPLHVEAVSYVAGLSDVLAAITVFGGLILVDRATRGRTTVAFGPFLALLALFFLGMTAKEGAVILLAAVVLTDILQSRRGQGMSGQQRAVVYGGMSALVLVMLGIRLAAVGRLTPDVTIIGMLDNPLIKEGIGVRFFTAMKMLAMQAWLLLWPQHLSVDYSFNAIPVARSLLDPKVLTGTAFVLAGTLFGLFRMRRFPWICWGLLFWLGASIFTSNLLVPIGTIFGERLMYLPSAGAALVVAGLLDPLVRSRRTGFLSPVGLLIVLGLTAALGWRTNERNKDFENTWALFESAAEVVPDSARVAYQLGALHAQQQLFTKAEQYFTKSLTIDNSFLQAGISLADVYAGDRRWDQALAQYDAILNTMSGDNAGIIAEIRRMVYTKRAAAKMGKGDREGARADLLTATGFSGERVDSHLALVQLHFNDGNHADAIPVLRNALLVAPGNLNVLSLMAQAASIVGDEAVYNEAIDGLEDTEGGHPRAMAARAELLYTQATDSGDADKRKEALAMFEEVRELNPELATPYIFRGIFLAETGRYYDAIIELDRALERHENHPIAFNFKAMAQLNAGRPQEALETLLELVKVRPDASTYRLLAPTYAQLGMVDEMEEAYRTLTELGVPASDVVLERAIRLEQNQRREDAMLAIEQALALPDMSSDPALLRTLGMMYLAADRAEEALATFMRQHDVELLEVDPDVLRDPFIPLNRARCLMVLGRDIEAAAQLEQFELRVESGSDQEVSLFHRRAELFLRPAGSLYNPTEAVTLADKALAHSRNGYVPFFLLSIEAHVAAGDLDTAQLRAREGQVAFPRESRFKALEQALGTALGGDRDAAIGALAGDDESLTRIADALSRA